MCALASALALAALTGCGSRPEPLRVSVTAAKRTLALGGVGYDVTFAGDHLFGPYLTLLGGRALYDLHAGLGYEALTLRGRDGTSQKVYLDLLPEVVYVAPDPAGARALPAGKLWIAVPISAGGGDAATRRLAAQLESAALELPLAEVAWGANDAVRVGSSVVGHVPLTEYGATVDLTRALAVARRHGRTALAAAMAEELATGHAKTVAVELWINGPGYVARIRHAVAGSDLGTATFSLSGFAETFGRSLPAAEQTVPLSALPGAPGSLWTFATGAR